MTAEAELLTQQTLWLGQHALLLYFVMLALLLAATSVGWWTQQRTRLACRQSTLAPAIFRGLRMAVGLAIVLLGVWLFAGLAGALGAGKELNRFDQIFYNALRASLPGPALQVFALLTHLADTVTLTVLCLVLALALVARSRRGLALGWVLALAGNGLLNQTLKQFFNRARPLTPDGLVLEQGLSFPSGHSSGAVVAYGMLAYLAFRLLPKGWHLPTLLAAVALAFTIGASRLFLRVHFASDVLAGFASGAAWLALCVMSMELIRRYQPRTA